MWIGIPLNGVPYFSAGTVDPDTQQMADADSLPTFKIYEESNTTEILSGTMVKIATGRYYGTFTASAANGFHVGKYYELIVLGTKTGSITGNAITSPKTGNFRCTPAELVAGYPPMDVAEWLGATAPANTGDAFARVGAAGAGLTALGDSRIAHLDADVSSRMSTALTGDFSSTMKTSLNAATPAVTVSDKTGFSLSAAGVQAIWDALTSALTTVGSIGKLIVTNLDAAISSRMSTTLTGDFSSTMKTSIGTAVAASAVASVTGNVGGSVASVTAAVAVTSYVKQNQALANYTFTMTSSTTHLLTAGLSLTVTRKIDGAGFGAGTLANVADLGNGIYSVDFLAGDLNGKVVTLRVTATGADDYVERIVTQP